MPVLSLRSVGMSYLIEGIADSTLDPGELLKALSESYGLAVAPMSTPRTLQPQDPDVDPPIDALIVDRRAVPWSDLRTWLEDHVKKAGHDYTAWAEDARDTTVASLHFHRLEKPNS